MHETPLRFDAEAAAEPTVRTIGYSSVDQSADLADLRAVVRTVTKKNDQIFDFTNAPGLFYFAADYDPPTRDYHVSTAIRSQTQLDLVEELRDARPALVAYDGGEGLNSWDGIPNSVRHYDVSSYILSHYRPFIRINGISLFLRNDIPVPLEKLSSLSIHGTGVLDDLYQSTGPCPWGLVANVSDQRPSAHARATTVQFHQEQLADGTYSEVIDRPADATAYRWLEDRDRWPLRT